MKLSKSTKILLGCILLALVGPGVGAVWTINNVNSYRAYVNERFQKSEARFRFMRKNLADKFLEYQTKRGEFNPTTSNNQEFNRVINGSWTRLAGNGEFQSWPAGENEKTKALTVFGDLLCTGLLGNRQNGAQVWCFDNSLWKKLGGNGLNKSWTDKSYVTFLRVFDNQLVAGVDDQVWKFDGNSWALIGSVNTADSSCVAYSAANFETSLFVGTTGCGVRLFRYSNDGFELVFNDNDPRYAGIYEQTVHQGNLYLGTMANFGTAAVFKFENGKLNKIAGDGHLGSWINPGFSFIESLVSTKDFLIVTMDRMPMVAQKISPIWAYDGIEWKPVGRKEMPYAWSEMINFNASSYYNSTLVVASGGIPGGLASVWALSPGGRFVKIGGAHKNNSWDRLTSNAEYVYRLLIWKNMLIAGFGAGEGMAQIWAYKID